MGMRGDLPGATGPCEFSRGRFAIRSTPDWRRDPYHDRNCLRSIRPAKRPPRFDIGARWGGILEDRKGVPIRSTNPPDTRSP
jgi:hypothetical protein